MHKCTINKCYNVIWPFTETNWSTFLEYNIQELIDAHDRHSMRHIHSYARITLTKYTFSVCVTTIWYIFIGNQLYYNIATTLINYSYYFQDIFFDGLPSLHEKKRRRLADLSDPNRANPKASKLTTSMSAFSGHTLERAYKKSGVFRARNPTKDDYIEISYDPPIKLSRYVLCRPC